MFAMHQARIAAPQAMRLQAYVNSKLPKSESANSHRSCAVGNTSFKKICDARISRQKSLSAEIRIRDYARDYHPGLPSAITPGVTPGVTPWVTGCFAGVTPGIADDLESWQPGMLAEILTARKVAPRASAYF